MLFRSPNESPPTTLIYYCEKGASQRPSKVIYDRAYSAIAQAKRQDFNWKEIFNGAEWFHLTGITPALSDECVCHLVNVLFNRYII